jgi:hypothetical protein
LHGLLLSRGKRMKVVDMRGVRDLLRDVEEMRQRILRGRIRGWALSVTDEDGNQAVYLGGENKTDSVAALRAGMAVSWEMTKATAPEQVQRRTG